MVMTTILERLAVPLGVVLSVTATTAQTQKLGPTKPARPNLAIRPVGNPDPS